MWKSTPAILEDSLSFGTLLFKSKQKLGLFLQGVAKKKKKKTKKKGKKPKFWDFFIKKKKKIEIIPTGG